MTHKFCTNCGDEITDDTAFCTGCGQKIECESATTKAEPDASEANANAHAVVGKKMTGATEGGKGSLEYSLTGESMQSLNITINPGQKVYAEAGKMIYMTDNISMTAKARGGLGGMLKRAVAQESVFITEFETVGGAGITAFAGSAPGKIRHIALKPGQVIMAQKDAFLCADDSVDFQVAFTKKFGAGLLGGEGFILEKLVGPGSLFIQGGGDFVEFDLKAGETIKVDTGCLVAFDESVAYDIQRAGGLKTSFFGGEGFFLAKMTGPGRVIIQTMPLARMAHELASYLPKSSN